MTIGPVVAFDGKNCSNCENLNERGYCKFTACIIPCTIIGNFPSSDPKTVFDRIRMMNIDEMADYLSGYFDCMNCPAKDLDPYGCAQCVENIKNWLNSKSE